MSGILGHVKIYMKCTASEEACHSGIAFKRMHAFGNDRDLVLSAWAVRELASSSTLKKASPAEWRV